MSESNQYLGFLQIILCLGPVVGVFVLWQLIKLMGLEYWLRVPRQSRLKQWGQNGLLFLSLLIIANLASYMLDTGPQPQRYGLLITLNMIFGTFFLFGIVISFMQSWISPEWVKWVVENYPNHYKEILLFASQGEERKKWRQNKNFEDFRQWVQNFVQDNFKRVSYFEGTEREVPLQSAHKAEILLEKLPLIIAVGISIFAIAATIWIGLSANFYFYKTVGPEEIGVQFEDGAIKAIVGPGTYSDIGKLVHLHTVSCAAIPFSITEDIYTQEKDAVILTINGNVYRLCNDKDTLIENWERYSDVFFDDISTHFYTTSLALEAAENCVGSYKNADDIFKDEVGLRTCIDDELNESVKNIGLRVEGIVISEMR